jgi:hypothetical protein
MNNAYHATDLYNLAVTKETRRWYKQDLITKAQWDTIHQAYPSEFYHPNFIVRILLFVATLLALSGVTGISVLILDSSSESTLSFCSLIYGVISFVVLDRFFIRHHQHYKSGLTEALLYHSCLFTLLGLLNIMDYNTHLSFVACLLVLSFAAYRYLDLVSTLAAIAAFTGLVFFILYDADGMFRQLIPFGIILSFTPIYFLAKNLKSKQNLRAWHSNLVIIEGASLLLVYAAGNYFVVRELSESMMNLYLEPGQDIPFAYLFYALTVIIPVAYFYFGITRKDLVLLRVSLIAIAFSVFTFKYYFSLGHPEITLTLAGIILLTVSLWLMQYLKVIRHGFTRENHLPEKWADMNVEAIIISQTLGGNQISEEKTMGGGGGDFGGGGATTNY